MKLKPVQVKNYAFGTVRIVDPSTQGEQGGYTPSSNSNTSTAWHIYAVSLLEGDDTAYRIYLPPFSLLFNGTYVPVEPIAGGQKINDYFDLTTFRGDLLCSVYKDNNNEVRAKLTIGPLQDAIFTFVVCSVSGNERGLSVTQYVSGTFSLNYGGKPFDPIVAINNLPNADDSGEDDGGEDAPTSEIKGFSNCYWMNGGVLQHMADQQSPGDDGFIALRVGATADTSGNASLIIRDSLAALQEEMKNPAYFVMPLYKVEDGVITVDFRSTPQAQVAEVL